MSLGVGVKVHADASELIEAENRITHFANHFEHTFMRKFSHAFGAGALAIGAIKLIESIFGKPEEIDQVSKKFKLSAEAVQLLQKYAKENGMTFEEMWEKAKKGAIDLDKALTDMRAKNPNIISGKNVGALNENRQALEGTWEGIKNGIINAVGGAIRRISNPENQENMRTAMGAMPGFGGPTAANLAAATRMNEYKPMGGEEEETDKEGFSHNEPGILRMKRQQAIEAEIKRLEEQRKGARGGNQLELMGATLTSRQSVGAYTAQTAEYATKLDKGNELLESIGKQIDDLKTQLEALGNG